MAAQNPESLKKDPGESQEEYETRVLGIVQAQVEQIKLEKEEKEKWKTKAIVAAVLALLLLFLICVMAYKLYTVSDRADTSLVEVGRLAGENRRLEGENEALGTVNKKLTSEAAVAKTKAGEDAATIEALSTEKKQMIADLEDCRKATSSNQGRRTGGGKPSGAGVGNQAAKLPDIPKAKQVWGYFQPDADASHPKPCRFTSAVSGVFPKCSAYEVHPALLNETEAAWTRRMLDETGFKNYGTIHFGKLEGKTS
jgi:hypothetical protein